MVQVKQYITAQQPVANASTQREQQNQLIPINFVALESQQRNNLGSAEYFGKPGYERYFFNCQGRYFYLDLSFALIEELGLTRGQNCDSIIYVAGEVLNRQTEYGGITIDNPQDIIIVRPNQLLEREVQTDL